MASARVVVWNMAIAIFGGSANSVIQSENDELPVVEWLKMFDQEAVDYVISPFEWVSHKEYAELGITADDIETGDWLYAYNLPADFLKIIKLTNETDLSVESEYRISGNYIFSNDADGYLEYMKKATIQDVTAMTPTTRDLIAKRLAVLIAPVFKPEMKSTAVAEWDIAYREARGVNQSNVYVKPVKRVTEVS